MAVTKVININVETGKSVKEVNKLNESIEQVEQSSKDVEQQNQKTAKGFKNVTTSIKGIGVALKSIGIGLIITAFAKLSDLLSQNQKVLDVVNTTWTSLSIVFQDLFSIFDEGLPSISEIGQSIKRNLIERFESALEVIGFLGKAVKQFFQGDFKGALESAKEAGKEFVDTITGVDNSIEKIVNYTSEVVKTAEAFTQLENSARLAEAQLKRVFEQSDRDAEIQRRIRDDFNKTFEERLEASKELARILDEQEKTQLRLAGLEVQRAQQAIKISGDNVDNQIALTQALAEQDAIQADIAGRRAEQEAQQRALEQEILAARREDIEETSKIREDVVKAGIKGEQDFGEELKKQQTLRQQLRAFDLQQTEAVEIAKLDIAQNTLGTVTELLGESSAAGKAAAIAQSTINAYQGVTEVWKTPSTLPEPFATISRITSTATVLASALKAVDVIKSQKLPSFAKGGGVSSAGGGGVQAPAFNVVGTSGVNQLAETLNQDQQPLQAFVVGNEVTTQQAMDRNIVQTATIG